MTLLLPMLLPHPVVCRSEIVQLQAGAERQRRKRLSTAAVVGVTCCAALQVGPIYKAVQLCNAASNQSRQLPVLL